MLRALVLSVLIAACGTSRVEATNVPGSGSKAEPKAEPAPMAEVSKVLDDWHDAASKAEEERYFAHFAEGGVFMGTDATERWTVPQFRVYAHPHFAKGKAWSFKATRRDITVRGDTAWFDEDLATPNLGPARGSGVLVWECAGTPCTKTWKIAHYNLTITVPNDRMKEVKTLLEGATPAP